MANDNGGVIGGFVGEVERGWVVGGGDYQAGGRSGVAQVTNSTPDKHGNSPLHIFPSLPSPHTRPGQNPVPLIPAGTPHRSSFLARDLIWFVVIDVVVVIKAWYLHAESRPPWKGKTRGGAVHWNEEYGGGGAESVLASESLWGWGAPKGRARGAHDVMESLVRVSSAHEPWAKTSQTRRSV